MVLARQLSWLNQILFKVTTMFAKLSLCVVYFGIFRRASNLLVRWTRGVNYFTAAVVIQ
jgi:hypothetical protein